MIVAKHEVPGKAQLGGSWASTASPNLQGLPTSTHPLLNSEFSNRFNLQP